MGCGAPGIRHRAGPQDTETDETRPACADASSAISPLGCGRACAHRRSERGLNPSYAPSHPPWGAALHCPHQGGTSPPAEVPPGQQVRPAPTPLGCGTSRLIIGHDSALNLHPAARFNACSSMRHRAFRPRPAPTPLGCGTCRLALGHISALNLHPTTRVNAFSPVHHRAFGLRAVFGRGHKEGLCQGTAPSNAEGVLRRRAACAPGVAFPCGHLCNSCAPLVLAPMYVYLYCTVNLYCNETIC